MAARRTRPAPEIDEHYATEIRLFLDNDRELYDRKIKAFLPNIARKIISGKYDASKAYKLWMFLVDDAVRKYDVEHGSGGKRVQRGWTTARVGSLAAVDKPTREAVARELAEYEHAALTSGEYGDLYTVAGRKRPAEKKARSARRNAGSSSKDWKNKTSGPPYNGHPSYAHWNVALWAGNDEGLYRALVRMKKDEAVSFLMSEFPRTPDGVHMTKTLAAYAWRSLKD